MPNKAPLLIGALALAACTAAPPPPTAQVAAAIGGCINSDQIVSRHVAGSGAVDFEMLGGVTYRNQLAQVCPGMDRLGSSAVIAIVNRGQGSQVCRGDQIRIYDPVEAKATGPANEPTCVLGNFVALPG
jgi:hypothetical protein